MSRSHCASAGRATRSGIMLTDEFCLDVLRALSGADRFGLSLSELAGRVWPGEADPRRHGVLGQALAELADKGLVLSSGGKRARYAVSPEGDAWLRRYRVVPGDAPRAVTWQHSAPPQPPELQPPRFPPAVEAAIDAALESTPEWSWLNPQQQKAIVWEKTQQIIDACVIDGRFLPALRDAALNEAIRRTRPLPAF